MTPTTTTINAPSGALSAPCPDWDEAFLRVESYLRAHQLHSRILLNQLTTEILAAARADARNHPHDDAVGLALRVAETRLDAWFARVLGPGLVKPGEHPGARARLALALADVPRRWPQHFLADTTPPPELIAAMRRHYLEAGPEVAFSNMAPRPLDLGPIASVAGETWATFRRWPLLRSLLGWAALLAAFATLWFSTR